MLRSLLAQSNNHRRRILTNCGSSSSAKRCARFLSSSTGGGGSDDDDKKKRSSSSFPQQQQQQQQRARRGGNMNRRRNNTVQQQQQQRFPKGKRNKGDNFDRRVLQPAARGELVAGSGSSGSIPRLTGRKPHAHLTPESSKEKQSRSFFGLEEEEGVGDDWEGGGGGSGSSTLFAALQQGRSQDWQQQAAGAGSATAALDENGDRDEYYAFELINDDKYYWREEEYEALDEEAEPLEPGEGQDEEGIFHIYYGPKALEPRNWNDDNDDDDSMDQDGLVSAATAHERDDDDLDEDEDLDFVPGGGRFPRRDMEDGGGPVDPEQMYFFDQNDIVTIAQEAGNNKDDDDDEDQKRIQAQDMTVLPLKDHGPDVDDFLEAVMETPANYVRATRDNLHPDSQREPKPHFYSKHVRQQPPADFVQQHQRFLYVTGLPPLEVNGEVGDLKNPVHRSLLQKTLAGLVGVDSSHVFPCNTTSGFVGFASPRELADALARGPSERTVSSVPEISAVPPALADHEFVTSSPPDTVVLLSNMPPGNTGTSLARELFPANTEVGMVYGGASSLSPNDFFFVSATTVLLRFQSSEQAASALDSRMVRERFQQVGQYPVRYFLARRELLHAGFGGPNRFREVRRMGPRLIVDGDMPRKDFYLSHAAVLQFRNLDPTLTKEQISRAVQPYCAQLRDVAGSIDFVTCHGGQPTGQAYVGFDIPGEAEDMLQAAVKGGRLLGLGDRPIIVRLVQNRRIPGQPPLVPEKRSERTEAELLDDLNNWEKYVDPADLEELARHGISKAVLDEALRTIRFRNPTFGPLDSTMRADALQPEKGFGQEYQELVQMFVHELKDCLATPDNVGLLYEALHFPDEPIDLSIFDREKERQKQIQAKRDNP